MRSKNIRESLNQDLIKNKKREKQTDTFDTDYDEQQQKSRPIEQVLY